MPKVPPRLQLLKARGRARSDAHCREWQRHKKWPRPVASCSRTGLADCLPPFCLTALLPALRCPPCRKSSSTTTVRPPPAPPRARPDPPKPSTEATACTRVAAAPAQHFARLVMPQRELRCCLVLPTGWGGVPREAHSRLWHSERVRRAIEPAHSSLPQCSGNSHSALNRPTS